jgi:hypothetical protein
MLLHILVPPCSTLSHPYPAIYNPFYPIPTQLYSTLKSQYSTAQCSAAHTLTLTLTLLILPKGLYATIEDAVVMRHLSQEAELTLGMLAFDAFPKFISK